LPNYYFSLPIHFIWNSTSEDNTFVFKFSSIMLLYHKLKYLFSETVSIFVIFLFVYASISKLTDYQKFKIQLGQSPILTPVAGTIAWFIPVLEITISILLFLPKYRLTGLYASFTLMTIFTAYIFAITRYSEFIPCSCGGVLQHMNWNQHLIFNFIFFTLIAGSILVYQVKPYKTVLLQ
jgi:uncharacterized membrane protein YphA (DoxX/SURF4 family)